MGTSVLPRLPLTLHMHLTPFQLVSDRHPILTIKHTILSRTGPQSYWASEWTGMPTLSKGRPATVGRNHNTSGMSNERPCSP